MGADTNEKNDKREVSVLLIGIGGYGRNYAEALADGKRSGRHMPLKIAGAVDVFEGAAQAAANYGIPFYGDIDAFYSESHADLAVISTPIHLHAEQTIKCLGRGSNVICEKPLCATIDEANDIADAERKAGKFVSVGYQMSFSGSVISLKADIAKGVFGRPRVFKTIVHYPRNESYYSRNGWAGRKRTKDGRMTLDSPIHNAVSHHLNNMLFLLGEKPDEAAALKTVQAELYRGNPDVDNFDTAAIRCVTQAGVEILFYTSHSMAYERSYGPINQFRLERATVFHADEREHEIFHALSDDGTAKRYKPARADQMQKLWDCVEAARGGPLPPSGTKAAAAEVLCVNGAQLSHPIVTIPAEFVRRVGEPGARSTEVVGLGCMLNRCFDGMLMPSELETGHRPPWVVPGKVVHYTEIADIANKI